MDSLYRELLVALAVGLLIGTERGWHGREREEGERVAGIRTFGLIGLLGGIWAALGELLGDVLLGFAFLGFTGLVIAAYTERRHEHDHGITTAVASLLAFTLGALAVRGQMVPAAATAVVTTLLLGLKPQLHRMLQALQSDELFAAIKLLLISVVLLPVLPNRAYGPWDTLNPYELWWLVVLIAAIGFVGYFAIKLAGPRRGILYTGLFGGLASSTATTFNFSHLGQRNRALQPVLAVGVVLASATMFPRVLVEVSVVHAPLLLQLWLPIVVMMVAAYGSGWLLFRYSHSSHKGTDIALPNPFELGPALKFGLLLVVILLLSKAAQQWFGDRGVYVLAVLSGITDVDAITLSLARLSRDGMDSSLAVRGIVIAAITNTLAKGALVLFIAGGTMARRVALAAGLTAIAGVLTLFWTV